MSAERRTGASTENPPCGIKDVIGRCGDIFKAIEEQFKEPGNRYARLDSGRVLVLRGNEEETIVFQINYGCDYYVVYDWTGNILRIGKTQREDPKSTHSLVVDSETFKRNNDGSYSYYVGKRDPADSGDRMCLFSCEATFGADGICLASSTTAERVPSKIVANAYGDGGLIRIPLDGEDVSIVVPTISRIVCEVEGAVEKIKS